MMIAQLLSIRLGENRSDQLLKHLVVMLNFLLFLGLGERRQLLCLHSRMEFQISYTCKDRVASCSSFIIWYSMPPFVSTYPNNLYCLFTICIINCLPVSALLSTLSIVTFCIQEIFIILHKDHISSVSSSFSIALLIVHASHPYIILLLIWHFISLRLV